MIHIKCLQEVYDRCHQQTRQQRRCHGGKHQHRAERHREFHLISKLRTKIIVLIYWSLTQARRHDCAVVLCVNEGI